MVNILVVDDSRLNIELAEKIITMHIKGVNVNTVTHPRDAIEVLSDVVYEIVLLDIVMPDINGIDVLKWIKKQERLKLTKVIMFSSLNDGESLAEAFSIGAYDYITKPIEKFEFIARIRHAIDEYEYLKLIEENVLKVTHKNRELKELNLKLKKTQSDLIQSERVAGIGYLAAGISHELNNPLSFVQSNVSVLVNTTDILFSMYEQAKKLLGEDQQPSIQLLEQNTNYEYLTEEMPEVYTDILNGMNRMTEIITALRNFSDIDAINEQEEIEIAQVAYNLKVLVKNRLNENIDFNMDIKTDEIIFANRGDLGLSFLNIVQNSIEAIECCNKDERGKIDFLMSTEVDSIVIIIKDNGIGMSEEVVSLALNPFYSTKDTGEGRGLGLSIAYNCFVNVLRGAFRIESKENVGTTIEIKIPKQKE